MIKVLRIAGIATAGAFCIFMAAIKGADDPVLLLFGLLGPFCAAIWIFDEITDR